MWERGSDRVRRGGREIRKTCLSFTSFKIKTSFLTKFHFFLHRAGDVCVCVFGTVPDYILAIGINVVLSAA